ncbi:MAG: anti-sigma factor family protein [Anaeromyxobacteraceae bacterium]
MTHDDARGLLLDLSYGELEPGEARAVREHLSGCAACGEEWARLGAARGFAAKAAEERVPERGRDAILEAARQAVSTPARRGRGTSRSVTWAAFATAAALLVVGGASLKLLDARSKGVSEVEAPWPATLPAAPVPPPAAAPAPATAPRPGAAARGAPEVAERSAPASKRAAPPRRNEAAARAREEIAAGTARPGPSFDSAAPRLRSGRTDDVRAAGAGKVAGAEATSGVAGAGKVAGGAGATSGAAGKVAERPAEKVGGGEIAAERSGDQRFGAAPAQEEAVRAKAAPAAEPERRLADSVDHPASGPASAPSMGEPTDRRAAAPPSAAAAPAAPRPARKAAAAAPSLGELADDVERRRAAGELEEETRVLSCAGAPLVRSVLRDRGGHAVKFTVRRAGEVAEGWYDDAGRLAASRGQVGDGAVLPPRDPAAALDAPCP